ncbi:MAG: chemotaxis response regulator protein-glutamate methylesterase [Cellvibrionaceae bacterium]|nr:chemotaxis response regulator protein-glutamate methylesterase [Cellvibrionaceae bacterium]
MVYKVLVVDDSSFFQMRLRDIINEHPELKVVGVAANGQEAIELADQLQPDIISMDYEMPRMDGVSAVRAIMAKRPVPIVMFSSMTYEGARVTLDALEAGAVDFIPKNFAEVSRNSAVLKKKLQETLLAFARQAQPRVESRPAPVTSTSVTSASVKSSSVAPARARMPESARRPAEAAQASAPRRSLKGKIKLLVIGASTGGPVALSEVIQRLPVSFPLPVIVIQHMPESFTRAFAERLDKICAVHVAEARDGDLLQPGHVLVAPGGSQLILDKRGSVKILPGDDRVSYKPSVDITFASAANVFGAGVLGVVLTGMGADGSEGARLLKEKGAVIWGQDQASCVVYGMPKAVAGLADEVLPLAQIGPRLAQDF